MKQTRMACPADKHENRQQIDANLLEDGFQLCCCKHLPDWRRNSNTVQGLCCFIFNLPKLSVSGTDLALFS